jgi:hypothetical protein
MKIFAVAGGETQKKVRKATENERDFTYKILPMKKEMARLCQCERGFAFFLVVLILVCENERILHPVNALQAA